MPKWITITPPRSSAGHRSTSPGQELFVGEKDDAVSVRRRFKDIQLQNTDDGQIQKTERVPLDLIVRAGEREMPKWITITPPRSSAGHRSTSPGQELFGNQAVVRRRKLELSNKCSLSKYLCLHRSGAPISSNTVAFPRHQACPELSLTSCEEDGEYRSADEECSWSNMTLADLYPAMVEIFTKLMAKHSERKVLKYMFGHLRSKRWPSRRSKLSVTLDKMRGFRPTKLKGAFHSPCSCRSEDSQSPTSGNESREFFCDNSLISNSSGLVPSAYTDTNDIKMVHSNSSLEHLASGKDQEVCKHTASPDIMDRMGETFIIEDELETTASPKNSEYTESEKLPYKRFSEPSFITSTASSGSRVPHLVKERETEKADFCVGSSEFCSSVCSSHSDSNNAIPTTNCSPARSSNTAFIYPERQTSFQHKGSFSSWFMKQSPKKMPNKYDDAFEELYYKVCSEEFQKSLTLTRPLINSQNLEEKGRLVKSNSSDFGPSTKQCDMEFDRMYEKLCRESVPKFFGFQTASNFRKCEEIQVPETVNALVNSPFRIYSAISQVKRAESFPNCLCSPVKRLKLTPEHCFSSRQCQELSPSIKGDLQTAGMPFLSKYYCSNPHFFADCNCHSQGSGSHGSSNRSFLGIPGTSLQESGTAGVHPDWHGAVEDCSSLRNVRKCHRRVYRKLSYTDEKD
ncbi:uncharacterized protein LOC134055630 isoform X1 [Cinclus cinclus]|uniref:uncharacterized protein LOC134055630 isoform X1 n=1 Tax=Cinclus cinclus TaxID=127875 RepID=UPI002E12109A